VQAQKIDYLADFDYLHQSIEENSVSYKLFCPQANFDGDSLYRKLRKELEQDPTFKKFINVSGQLFNVSADKHNHFIYPSLFHYYLNMYVSDTEKTALIQSVDSTKLEESLQKFQEYKKLKRELKQPWSQIRTTFWEGRYYITYDYEIDGVKISRKSIVKKINGLDPSNFYKQNMEQYFPYFDINTNAFYANNIFSLTNIDDTSMVAIIETPKKEQIKIAINNDSDIESKSGVQLSLKFSNYVEYLNRYNTLYIRYFSFAPEFQPNQIVYELEKYKEKHIDKIIVDVRGNGGGSDLLWIQLMNAIRNTIQPIRQPKTCVFENSTAKAFLTDGDQPDTIHNESLLVFDNDILNYIAPKDNIQKNKDYDAIRDLYEGLPDLGFEGEIYCLTDDVSFSASLSFASLKYYYKNFHVVSDVAPYYGGFSTTPVLYMLPSSKLMYRLTSNFDYHLYQNNYRVEPDITVGLNIDDLILRRNRKIMNFNSKKYMGKKNKYIRAVLEKAK
jgi:hypothetical protein